MMEMFELFEIWIQAQDSKYAGSLHSKFTKTNINATP